MHTTQYNPYMKEYVSCFSVVAFWNIPCIEVVLGFEIAETDSFDFTVSERSARSQKNGRASHLCQLALPSGAVVSRNGKMIASPELMFLQLACKLNIHRLILLGLQLCSHPPGNPSGAITTKQNLKTFLAKTSGHRGHPKALRAVKYLENGSASIMESMEETLMNGIEITSNRIEILRRYIDKIILDMTDVEERRCAYLHLYGVAQSCALIALKRGESAELATMAGMLHDIYAYAKMDTKDHANKGANLAREILAQLKITNDEETKMICDAIFVHSEKEVVHSDFSELLKDGDVFQHCLYNPMFDIKEHEIKRFGKLKREFGITK